MLLANTGAKGQMLVDFVKRMGIAMMSISLKQRVTYKIGERCAQVDYILCRRCNLKAIQDCKVVSGENMEIIKRKQVKVEARAKLWKLKKDNISQTSGRSLDSGW